MRTGHDWFRKIAAKRGCNHTTKKKQNCAGYFIIFSALNYRIIASIEIQLIGNVQAQRVRDSNHFLYHTLKIIRTIRLKIFCVFVYMHVVFCFFFSANYANVKTIKEKWFRLVIIRVSNQQGYWNHHFTIWGLEYFTTFYILLFSSELAHFFVLQSCIFVFLMIVFQCIYCLHTFIIYQLMFE